MEPSVGLNVIPPAGRRSGVVSSRPPWCRRFEATVNPIKEVIMKLTSSAFESEMISGFSLALIQQIISSSSRA